MNLKYIKLVGIGLLALGLSSSATSAEFWKTGTVLRVMSNSTTYGGCMVELNLNTNIRNGCPNNKWVSLDCTNTYFTATDSKNKYALALTALVANKKLSIKIDNTKKHDGACVATRVDIRNTQ
jgi:hypothetical protein